MISVLRLGIELVKANHVVTLYLSTRTFVRDSSNRYILRLLTMRGYQRRDSASKRCAAEILDIWWQRCDPYSEQSIHLDSRLYMSTQSRWDYKRQMMSSPERGGTVGQWRRDPNDGKIKSWYFGVGQNADSRSPSVGGGNCPRLCAARAWNGEITQ